MAHRFTHRNLPQLFLKSRDTLMSYFRPVLNHFGLTEQQWRILRALDEHERLEPRELCDLCQILSPSMAGMLTRMEQMGLIDRSRVAADQRRVLVRLSTRGDALIDEMAPLIEAQYHYIEQAFGKRIFDQLSDALEEFVGLQQQVEKQMRHVALPEIGRPAGRQAPAGPAAGENKTVAAATAATAAAAVAAAVATAVTTAGIAAGIAPVAKPVTAPAPAASSGK